MAAVKWTEAQTKAIETRGTSLLVSAAAGSGKTATLTRRIITSLLSGKGDISRMLIVTFTRAAVAELKERIEKALEAASVEDPTLRRQLYLLESAKICTIHSFCLDVIRPNFDKVGLPAKFRTLDEAEEKILKRSTMDQLVSDCYENEWERINPGSPVSFTEFRDCFSADDDRDDSKLIELFLKISAKLSGLYDKDSYFLHSGDVYSAAAAADPFSSDNPYGDEIKKELTDSCNYYRDIFLHYKSIFETGTDHEKKYLPTLEGDLAIIDKILKSSDNGFDAVRNAVNGAEYNNMASVNANLRTRECNEYRELRSRFKKLFKEKLTPVFAGSADSFRQDCKRSAEICYAANGFINEYDRRYGEAKRRLCAIDYNDMEHMACSLLYLENGEKSDLAKALSESFDEIYIDEYQDVNALQDKIFSAVSKRDNRFMVGDIKQSIYGFRGAMPDIFADYRRLFSDEDGDGRVIFMSENFRSDSTVIDFSNAVFDTLWKRAGDSMDYRDGDRLICGKNGGDTEKEKVEILLIKGGKKSTKSDDEDEYDDDSDDKILPEAVCVAEKIKELLQCGVKSDGTPILPRDIAIITRSIKDYAIKYEEALISAGIPVQNKERKQLFENPEILLMLCLLTSIDNPRQDIHLLGTMMSPVFAFTLDETVRIRKAASEKGLSLYDSLLEFSAAGEEGETADKVSFLLSELSKYRRMAEGSTADRLIWRLYRECGIMALLEKGEDGGLYSERRANLLALHEYARSYEAGGYRGLYSFINYVNGLIATDAKVSSPEFGDGKDNAVKIISIHSSKGLEFPVCFVVGCGKKYPDLDTREPIVFDLDLGMAMKLRIKDHFAVANTPTHRAVVNRMKRTAREEELRILYVAFTRARERLYVTATLPDPEKRIDLAEIDAKFLDKYSILHFNSYIDTVLPAIILHSSENKISDTDSCFNISVHVPANDEDSVDLSVSDNNAALADPLETARAADILRSRLAFSYEYDYLRNIPAKVSVSRLYPDMLDPEEEHEYSDEAEDTLPVLAATPQFLGGESGFAAEAGTATHVFMQFCDFERLRADGVDAELDRLVSLGFLTGEMRALVRRDEITRFVSSSLFRAMMNARELWREQRFNIFLDASRFTENSLQKERLEDEKLLVQGVIDCFFISDNGELVLVDYKTDRLTGYQLSHPTAAEQCFRERHGRQLDYYKAALGEILGRKVDRCLIYSLCLGDVIEV